MAIVTANIIAGNYSLSEELTVKADVSNGTIIVVYRGEFLIGSGAVMWSQVKIAVPPLAIGDIIQASVTERGNQSGIPVRVGVNPDAATGWLQPETVQVTDENGQTTVIPTQEYETTYGETPGAILDPVASGLTQLPDDYDNTPDVELGFDLAGIQVAGSTTLRVMPRNGEGLLVGWNNATPTSAAPITLTASATITVAVIRDDDPTTTLTRSISVIVLPAPTNPSAPAAGDIIAAGYQFLGNGWVRGRINSLKPCEAMLIGYSAEWKPGVSYGPQYQEVDWVGPVPGGTYTVQIRVIGETNVANYTNFIISF